MKESLQLTELQLAILRVFWRRGAATVAEVHQDLRAERGLALSTVATLVSRLEKRGVLARTGDGRQYVYRATVSEDEVRHSMVSGLTSLLFGGDARALVSYLVRTGQIGPGDLEHARALPDSRGAGEVD
ncbi:MAG TPA: BlaI/MecI/CopY family transcriptional regulator [Longimicrobiaceae bacterium]|nr:BlaI/MecI/CopY family transcriptional regulator [Longimicrobiaceae bacterium]